MQAIVIARYEFKNYFSRILRNPRPWIINLGCGGFSWICLWFYIFFYYKNQLPSLTEENVADFIQINKILIGSLFFLVISYTLYYTLGKRRGRNLEILFSTPIKPKDIYLGSLLAISPVYLFIFLFICYPYLLFFVVLNIPLLGIMLTISSFFLVFFSALAIGESLALIIDAYIKKFLLKFPQLRFFLGILGFVIYLSLFYGRYMFGTSEENSSITFQLFGQLITLLPSSLALQVLDETIKPSYGNVVDYSAIFWNFFILIICTVGILGLGLIWANRVFSFAETLEAISGKVAKEGYLDRWIRKVLNRLPIDHIEPIMTQNKLLFRDPQAIQRVSITLASILIATPLLGVVAILENKENPLFQEDPVIQAVILVGMMTFFIMPLSVVPLVTTTFFLSKEQIWIWDRVPHGRMEFMNTKTVQTLILSIMCPVLFWFASLISLTIIEYPSLEARLTVLFLAGLFSLLGGLLLVNCILLGMIVCGYYPVTEIRGSKQVRNTLMILGGLFIIHFPLFVIILSVVGTVLPLPPTPAFILLSLIITLSLTLFIALIFLIVYYRHTVCILDSKEYLNV